MPNLMIESSSGRRVLSAAARQILQDQKIAEDGPGTILPDFETLLAFIGQDGLTSTGKYYFLPQSKLAELNQRMSRPVPNRLQRPQQRSFPHLHGQAVQDTDHFAER